MKVFSRIVAIVFVTGYGLFMSADSASAATRTWSGTTSTSWSVSTNWVEGSVPTSADDVIINTAATNQPILDLSGGAVTITSLSLGSSAVSTLTLSNGDTSTKKLVTTADVSIGGSGTLTHTANGATQVHSLFVEVGGNMTIAVGGKIDVTGKGFAGGALSQW